VGFCKILDTMRIFGCLVDHTMKGLLSIIIIVAWCTGCKSSNTNFYPFDQDFRFHKNFNLADYDTIMGECGYWNLTNRKDGTYYQFFSKKEENSSKGI
jgi:hypothetical protein